jgi:methyl-accepting chemotaxis protein
MTEQEITEMRSRIAELSERDEEFARKSNLLLDEILLTRDQAEKNTRAIAETRRDIDQLAQRTGELTQSISEYDSFEVLIRR